MGIAMSGVVAVAGIVASVATGGLASSSMALRNDSSEPVVVRFTVPGQYATFGYRLLAGESGIGTIQSFDVSDMPARVAAQVPRGARADGKFNADDWVPPKDQRRMDMFIIFAMAAAVFILLGGAF